MHANPHRTALTAAQASAPQVTLHVIADDLRRLARDVDRLERPGDLPEWLAALVGAVMEAVGRPAPVPAMAPIVEAVCAAFRVTHDEIVSPRRGQHIALARQVAIYLIRELTDYSFPCIGGYFRRDHSTAIHSHTQIARRVAAEASFRALTQKLKDALAAHDVTGAPVRARAPRSRTGAQAESKCRAESPRNEGGNR